MSNDKNVENNDMQNGDKKELENTNNKANNPPQDENDLNYGTTTNQSFNNDGASMIPGDTKQKKEDAGFDEKNADKKEKKDK